MRWPNGRCIRLLDKKQSIVKCRLSPFYVVRLKLALAGYLSTNELKYCTFVGQPEKFRGGGGVEECKEEAFPNGISDALNFSKLS